MKKKITNMEEQVKAPEGQLITRKQALKRSGYMALSAATMLLLLNDDANGQPKSSPAAPSNNSPSIPNQPDGIWQD